MTHFRRIALLPCIATLPAWLGCGPARDPNPDLGPTGPVAENAAEAWPTQPANVPTLTEQEILDACALAGACAPEVMKGTLSERATLVDLCVFDAVYSIERAIPISGLSSANERVEFWVGCVLDGAAECAVVNACKTERDKAIACQEDGCRAADDFAVSCKGDVATLAAKYQSFSRDCSRAFATCDAESPTGCTDRHYTACPAEGSQQDRCDGNVRLGCDGAGQVSWHDCARLGGSCGTLSNGGEGCLYPEPRDAECQGESPAPASCQADTLSACVNGRRLSVATPLCVP